MTVVICLRPLELNTLDLKCFSNSEKFISFEIIYLSHYLSNTGVRKFEFCIFLVAGGGNSLNKNHAESRYETNV